MELKNRDIKSMKKYLIIMLTLSFVGCSSIPIKSDNGSFRSSLKPEYYKKGDYVGLSGLPKQQMLNHVDIDEVIRHGIITVYLLNLYVHSYIRLDEDGLRPLMGADKLYIIFYRIYDGRVKGLKITIWEELGNKVFSFVTYQEVSKNEKGKFVIRNVSKEEATRKRVKWDDTKM